MAKTIVVVGFGPGVSRGVAERFGAAGFSVALVGRSAERLAAGVEALKAEGIAAAAFVADAGDARSIAAAVGQARAVLGPVHVLHWNAFGGSAAPDLLSVTPATVRDVFDIGTVGLLSAIEAALPDLTAADDGAVLVTNGAFGDPTPQMDAYAVGLKSMGVALANAAKAKLVGLLSERLKAEGVYVGEVTIAGVVKGTAWAAEGGIDPAKIAGLFWELYQARGEVRARVM